jgi:formylglycine-generating enzyme
MYVIQRCIAMCLVLLVAVSPVRSQDRSEKAGLAEGNEAQPSRPRGDNTDDFDRLPKRSQESAFAVYVRWPFSASEARQRQEETAKAIGQPVELTNSIGMRLRLIPGGEFMMGSIESAKSLAEAFEKFKATPEMFSDQFPQHRVRITKPYYLGAHEVTVRQFWEFVKATGYKTEAERNGKGGWGYSGNKEKPFKQDPRFSWRNLGYPQSGNHPVVNVSWNDAVAFCAWLSRKEGHTYRLPTEAEWEYACRAGTQTRYCNGDDPEKLAEVGNVADAAIKEALGDTTISARDGYVFAAPVGQFRPNAWGLYDMHGNVAEWCTDWYVADYYVSSPLADPSRRTNGTKHVSRGGSAYG